MEETNKKVKQGTVVSTKMDKSVVVLVETRVLHPLYKRTVRKSKKYVTHDEFEKCKVGDTVKITECRPISKLKKWRLKEIINTQS